jgi:hypothetical protein
MSVSPWARENREVIDVPPPGSTVSQIINFVPSFIPPPSHLSPLPFSHSFYLSVLLSFLPLVSSFVLSYISLAPILCPLFHSFLYLLPCIFSYRFSMPFICPVYHNSSPLAFLPLLHIKIFLSPPFFSSSTSFLSLSLSLPSPIFLSHLFYMSIIISLQTI